MPQQSIGSPALWIGFIAFIVLMLALDLGAFHRKAHTPTVKESLIWSLVWVSFAALFNVGVYIWFGSERALEFAAGYVIEKALAVDNIFVFVMIFSAFAVPREAQHRVLFWGVGCALVMRAAFIFAGAAVLQRFHWAAYLFGALLVGTGAKLLFSKESSPDIENNPIVRWVQRFVPVAPVFDGARFWTLYQGHRRATPLLLALVAVEVSDLVFALDSIPAIFAVTSDPFIVFTSNIFAILGLRSLYFLLAELVTRFAYLKVGLSFVLVFVGIKMLIVDFYKVPIGASLFVIAALLGGAILFSWFKARKSGHHPVAEAIETLEH